MIRTISGETSLQHKNNNNSVSTKYFRSGMPGKKSENQKSIKSRKKRKNITYKLILIAPQDLPRIYGPRPYQLNTLSSQAPNSVATNLLSTHSHDRKSTHARTSQNIHRLQGSSHLNNLSSLSRSPAAGESDSVYKRRVETESFHKVSFNNSYKKDLLPLPVITSDEDRTVPSKQEREKTTKLNRRYQSTVKTRKSTLAHSRDNIIPETTESRENQSRLQTDSKPKLMRGRKSHFETDQEMEADFKEAIVFCDRLVDRTKHSISNYTKSTKIDGSLRISQVGDKETISNKEGETWFTKPSQSNTAQNTIRQLVRKSMRANIFRIKLPQKAEEVPPYISRYEPINRDLKDLVQSIPTLLNSAEQKVAVIPYKQFKALYFGEVNSAKKRHGRGVFVCQNYIFEGDFADDVKVQGYEINSEGIYRGCFSNQKRNGYGEFEWYNGENYAGHWCNNTKHGQGTWTKPNGQSYTGEWAQNRIEGQGKYTFGNGHIYEGSFLNFMKHGSGKEVFPNGNTYQGAYKNGLPQGKGKYSWSESEYYEGDFYRGLRHGKGKYVRGEQVCESVYVNDRRVVEGDTKQELNIQKTNFTISDVKLEPTTTTTANER